MRPIARVSVLMAISAQLGCAASRPPEPCAESYVTSTFATPGNEPTSVCAPLDEWGVHAEYHVQYVGSPSAGMFTPCELAAGSIRSLPVDSSLGLLIIDAGGVEPPSWLVAGSGSLVNLPISIGSFDPAGLARALAGCDRGAARLRVVHGTAQPGEVFVAELAEPCVADPVDPSLATVTALRIEGVVRSSTSILISRHWESTTEVSCP